MKKQFLTNDEVNHAVAILADRIMYEYTGEKPIRLYGVPRGGIPVAYLLTKYLHADLVDNPDDATVIVDDIIDSGATMARYAGPFYALIDQTKKDRVDRTWFVFPWENGGDDKDYSATDIVTRTLQYIGEDPERDGLKDTPRRVLKAWDFMFQGYHENPADILARTFDNDEHYNEMVILRNVEFYSCCEHHMLPFFGQAHIAYIPREDGRVAGISKLARLVNCFARRLQVQERMTKQIVDALTLHLMPLGAACFIEAQHLCLAGDSRMQLAYLNREEYPDGVLVESLLGSKNIPVYCYDNLKNSITIGNIRNVWCSGKRKVFKITYEWFSRNQHKKIRKIGCIKVTSNHPIMLRRRSHNHYNNKNRTYTNGTFLSIEGGLTVGDSLMPFTCEGTDYKTLFLNNGKTVQEHRFLLEYKLKRKLTSNEVCHHINENPLDNSIKNLELITSKGEHSRGHLKGKKNPNFCIAWNRKPRKTLICENCKKGFNVKFAYMEKTRRFCSRKCHSETRFANHKIISIEEVGIEKVYDVEVEKYHNFAVNGIIVHNCMKARGVEKQSSTMVTSALSGVFKEQATRMEFLLLKGGSHV